MRQKTDPVNIIIAVILIMVAASVWLLGHRIKQAIVPDAPVSPPAAAPAPAQP